MEAGIRAVDGVTDVHELHVWEVTSGFPALSAHVLVDTGVDCHERRLAIEEVVGERFGIDHTTLQVDHRDDGASCLGAEPAGCTPSQGDHPPH